MQRGVPSLLMSLTGVFFFFVFVWQDIHLMTDMERSALPWSLIIRYAVAMAVGGAVSGGLFCKLFGKAGVLGWVLAILGGLLAALFAGAFGSAFGLLPDLLADGWTTADAVKVIFGILVVPLSLIEQPWLTLVFLGAVAVTHVCVKRLIARP